MGFLQRHHTPRNPSGCPKCGYSLRGLLAHRCPECGAYVGGIAAEPDNQFPTGVRDDGPVWLTTKQRTVAGLKTLLAMVLAIAFAWFMWESHRRGSWAIGRGRAIAVPPWFGWTFYSVVFCLVITSAFFSAKACVTGKKEPRHRKWNFFRWQG